MKSLISLDLNFIAVRNPASKLVSSQVARKKFRVYNFSYGSGAFRKSNSSKCLKRYVAESVDAMTWLEMRMYGSVESITHTQISYLESIFRPKDTIKIDLVATDISYL